MTPVSLIKREEACRGSIQRLASANGRERMPCVDELTEVRP